MKVRSAAHGGLAEVSDEYGARLIESGLWRAVEEGHKAPVRKARSPRAKKVAPVEEPQPEE